MPISFRRDFAPWIRNELRSRVTTCMSNVISTCANTSPVATGSRTALSQGQNISLRRKSLQGAPPSTPSISWWICSQWEIASSTWSLPFPRDATCSQEKHLKPNALDLHSFPLITGAARNKIEDRLVFISQTLSMGLWGMSSHQPYRTWKCTVRIQIGPWDQ